MRTTNENKAVTDLRDDIMSELQHEDVAVQIRVAFAVLIGVILDASTNDPEETRVALGELHDMMRLVS